MEEYLRFIIKWEEYGIGYMCNMILFDICMYVWKLFGNIFNKMLKWLFLGRGLRRKEDDLFFMLYFFVVFEVF